MDLSVDCFAVDFAVDFVVDFSVDVFVDFLGRGFCCRFLYGFSSTVVVEFPFAVFRDPVDPLVDLFSRFRGFIPQGLKTLHSDPCGFRCGFMCGVFT